tara:strand:- start:4607 stop:4966 length:360 start_codon:yes stop_codon:yes gene_type:complete
MAVTKNLTVDQGSTYVHNFTVQESNGDATDLTNYSARLQVRRSYDNSNVILEATNVNNKINVDASNGILRLTLLPADTSNIGFTGANLEAVYDLEIESIAGVVTRLIEGSFTIDREVTR